MDDIEQGSGFIGKNRVNFRYTKQKSEFLISTDASYVQFFGDDFLRTLILRFVFCDVTMRLHRSFRGRHQRPRCEPPLPAAELLEHPSLAHIVLQLATQLDVRGHFSETVEVE